MSYDFSKAFLAANAEQFKEGTQGQSFVIPGVGVWVVVRTTPDNTPTGYQAALLKNSADQYVMVSRGTEPLREPLRDFGSDIQMGAGRLPDQVSAARSFLEISTKYINLHGGNPNTQLSLVGPSLGGSITQVLGAENPSLKADAFNPYCVGNLIAAGNYANVTTHVMARDLVSVLPGSKSIGTTFMYTEPGNTKGDTTPTLGSHFASNFVDPSVSKQPGKAVVIDVTPDHQRPLRPIPIIPPQTAIKAGLLDPNTLLPKRAAAALPCASNTLASAAVNEANSPRAIQQMLVNVLQQKGAPHAAIDMVLARTMRLAQPTPVPSTPLNAPGPGL